MEEQLERTALVFRLPKDGLLTVYALNGRYISGALPQVGERIRVRTCDSRQAYTAVVIAVDSNRSSYRARVDALGE